MQCSELIELVPEGQDIAVYYLGECCEHKYVYTSDYGDLPRDVSNAVVHGLSVSDDGALEIEVEDIMNWGYLA